MKKNKFIKITLFLVVFFASTRLLWFGFLDHKGIKYDASRFFFQAGIPCVEIKNLSLSKNIPGQLVIKNCAISLQNSKDFFSSFCRFYKIGYRLKNITYQNNNFSVSGKEFFGNLEHLSRNNYTIQASCCKKLAVSKKEKTVMLGDSALKAKCQDNYLDFDFCVFEGISSKGKLLLQHHKRPKGEVTCEFKDFKLFLKKIEDFYPVTKIAKGVLNLLNFKPNQEFVFDFHDKGINLGPLQIYSYTSE